MDNYLNFQTRINKFLDKYYKNLIFKGLILAFILFSVIILIVSTVEYVLWFDKTGRLFLLSFSILSLLYILFYFLIIPIFRFLGIFKRLTIKNAAKILSIHFPELKDYVHNIVELNELKLRDSNSELISAALNQKIERTKHFDFQKVVSSKNIIPLLKYSLSIFILYIILLFFKPDVIIDGSTRIMHFKDHYERNIGYSISVDESLLNVEKGTNLTINATITGEVLPEYLSLFIGSTEYLMVKKDLRQYYFVVNNVNNSFYFKVGNNDIISKSFEVSIVKPPVLKSFIVKVKAPAYTNLPTEEYTNISNIRVANGSKISWTFSCYDVNHLFYFIDSLKEEIENIDDEFSIEKVIFSSINYKVEAVNNEVFREFIPSSFITKISDLYPEITVNQVNDVNDATIVHFKGLITDDYGFHNLFFVVNEVKIKIPYNSHLNNQEFYFSYEFHSDESSAYDYYFEVLDNDIINDYKSTKSESLKFTIPNFEELVDFKNKEDNEIFKKIEQTLLLAEEFKKDIENVKKKIFNESNSKFEKKQLLDDILNKQNSLEELLDDINKQNLNKNKQFNSFQDQSKELLEKQNQIQEMMNNVMDDELRTLLDELRKLNEEFDDKNLKNNLDKLELNYDQLSEQLDKNLELLKKYEIERNLENISQELLNISKDQKNLAENSTDKNNYDSLMNKDLEKSKSLNSKFNKEEENNSLLNNPLKLEDLNEDFQELSDNIEKGKEDNLTEQNSQKSNSSENSEKAKKLSDKIQAMLNNNRAAEDGENEETLRQILENLIYFSFKIEELNDSFKKSSRNSPNYFYNIKQQNELGLNYSIIKDSLTALSKRTTYLGNHISKKAFFIENCLFDIDEWISEDVISKAGFEQRKALEASNDLILLLSESLKNMENSSGSGSGSSKKKKKPKKSKPSLSEMRKSQESMKSQLEGMIKQMKEGKGKNGKPGSDQLGKMLAQQEVFQQMLSQLQNSNSGGKEFSEKLNEINKLIEENKRDIIKNNINPNTLIRQKNIVTRMLEAEKSDMERELDDKRKSKESIVKLVSEPALLFDVDEKNTNFNDILNKNTIKLNYYYKNKYQEYLRNLNY